MRAFPVCTRPDGTPPGSEELCSYEAHAIAAIPRQLALSRVVMAPGSASRLLVVVRLSSERARQAVRQDCSFAKSRTLPRRSWSSSIPSVSRGPSQPEVAANQKVTSGLPVSLSNAKLRNQNPK